MSENARSTTATVIPTLRYRDAAAAIEWLCEAFGFEKRGHAATCYLGVQGAAHGVGEFCQTVRLQDKLEREDPSARLENATRFPTGVVVLVADIAEAGHVGYGIHGAGADGHAGGIEGGEADVVAYL